MNKKCFLALMISAIFLIGCSSVDDNDLIPDPQESDILSVVTDEGFKEYIKDRLQSDWKQYDTDNSGILSFEEVKAIGSIAINNNGEKTVPEEDKKYVIASVEGIQYFSGLTFLDLSDLGLTSADLSGNTNLDSLYIWGNELTGLDVSHNIKLKMFDCSINKLGGLGVTGLPELKRLVAHNNPIETIDLTQNPELKDLFLYAVLIEEIDLTKNPKLSTAGLDDTKLSSLDVSQNPDLWVLGCGKSNMTELDITHNPKLISLSFHETAITSIDLSNNPEMRYLDLWESQVNSLDLTKCPEIRTLSAYDCSNLSEIDLSKCLNLQVAYLSRSPLDIIYIAPGFPRQNLIYTASATIVEK